MFGLRKKKRNFPRPVGNTHTNRIKINQPLFTIKYWQLLPKSSNIFTAGEYKLLKNKVLIPEDIVKEKLDASIQLTLPRHPERPTLYTLSNIAFPYRWIDRKVDWTKEELKQIEMDEAEGSAWWFRHGPGK
jgi:hypothetical protein